MASERTTWLLDEQVDHVLGESGRPRAFRADWHPDGGICFEVDECDKAVFARGISPTTAGQIALILDHFVAIGGGDLPSVASKDGPPLRRPAIRDPGGHSPGDMRPRRAEVPPSERTRQVLTYGDD